MFWLVFFSAFAALISLAAVLRSIIVGDYRIRPPDVVTPSAPLEPDGIAEAMKQALRRKFAAEQAALEKLGKAA